MHIELQNIHKHFGKVYANKGINLQVPESSIVGILGENGAGKSTLMKILSGFICPDSGTILLDGKKVEIDSPYMARCQGIGMLHQDPQDFPPFTLVENFILGSRGSFWQNKKEVSKAIYDLSFRFGFSLNPESYVDSLSVGERQQLEILRLLWLGSKTLILDEPTTGISLPQKKKLFITLKALAKSGMSIIFVSHKLEDVEELCSKAVILRQGILEGEYIAPFNAKTLLLKMFGPAQSTQTAAPKKLGTPILQVKNLSLESSRIAISKVSLTLCAGEVVGLAGMEGSGQLLFLSACAGLEKAIEGDVIVGADSIKGKSYHEYKRRGVVYIPAARIEDGLMPGMSIAEHLLLSEGDGGIFINKKRAKSLAQSRISTYNIKGLPESNVESLSGGNQQRTLLSLMRDELSLILIEHPTRGLDIESTSYIWTMLHTRCQKGAAIMFISSDLDEILKYSNRILVFFAGKVSPPILSRDTSVEALGALIGGKGWEDIDKAGFDTKSKP